jgi:hypothetical protein
MDTDKKYIRSPQKCRSSNISECPKNELLVHPLLIHLILPYQLKPTLTSRMGVRVNLRTNSDYFPHTVFTITFITETGSVHCAVQAECPYIIRLKRLNDQRYDYHKPSTVQVVRHITMTPNETGREEQHVESACWRNRGKEDGS